MQSKIGLWTWGVVWTFESEDHQHGKNVLRTVVAFALALERTNCFSFKSGSCSCASCVGFEHGSLGVLCHGEGAILD